MAYHHEIRSFSTKHRWIRCSTLTYFWVGLTGLCCFWIIITYRMISEQADLSIDYAEYSSIVKSDAGPIYDKQSRKDISFLNKGHNDDNDGDQNVSSVGTKEPKNNSMIEQNYYTEEDDILDDKILNVTSPGIVRNIINCSADLATTNAFATPPCTPGAFIHLGKTGGSTLSLQMRNGCHSWVTKPCRRIPHNESHVSLMTTYYHTSDFDILSNYTYDFYIISLRDPLSRTISAFLQTHPENLLEQKWRDEGRKYHRPKMKGWYKNWQRANFKKMIDAYSCIPTLDHFAAQFDSVDNLNMAQVNCTREVGKRVMNHEVKEIIHLYWDLTSVLTQINILKETKILVVRQEYLWEDWKSVNQWLGQKDVAIFPQVHERNSRRMNLPMMNNITEVGKQHLCKVLEDEYEHYINIVQKAVNLKSEDFKDTIRLAKSQCPQLQIRSNAAEETV